MTTSALPRPVSLASNRCPAESTSIVPPIIACGVCIALANVAAPIGMLAAVVLTAVLLAKKQYGLVILFLLAILTISDNRTPALAAGISLRYPVVIVIGFFSLRSALSRAMRREVLYFVPFVAAAVIGLASGNGGSSITDGALKTVSYLLLVAIVFQFIVPVVERAPLRYARAIWRMYAFILVAGLALIALSPDMAYFPNGRFRGLLGNPDGAGGLTSLLLPFEFALLDATSRKRRGPIWLVIGLTILTLLLSGSRGALVGAIVFFFTRATLRLGWIGRLAVLSAATLLVFGVVRVVSDPELLDNPALVQFVRPETIETGSGRFFAWAYAMDYVRSAPGFGRGFGFDEFIFDDEHRETVFLDRGGHQGLVHNGYLGFALDAGVIGLVLYIGFVVAVVRRTGAAQAVLPMLAVVAWSCMVEGWIVSSLNAYTIIFYFSLVLIPRLAPLHQPVRGSLNSTL